MKIAIVRGAFANPAELQNFEPLLKKHEIVVFGSKNTKEDRLLSNIPLVKLSSPYDYVGKNKYLRGIFNRLFVDSHYLFSLEEKLRGFDIAHCAETYYGYTQQCLNAKKKGYVKKVFATVWENIPFNNEGIRGRKEFKKRAFKEMDKFIAVTNKAKEALIAEGCDPQKITVIPMGVDLKKFKPMPKPKTARMTILFVGRPVKEKGIEELKKLNLLNFELKVISGGVSYEKMPQIYQEADIFIHPVVGSKTWAEQFGMVLIEAMASGLPIITTDCGSIPEVVGDAAIITKDLRTDLQKLIDNKNLRKILAKKARLRAETCFDRQKIAEKISRIYESIR
ncbi:MAG: glycosyltransferase family 4 protein [Patescibacteria group bacterium]